MDELTKHLNSLLEENNTKSIDNLHRLINGNKKNKALLCKYVSQRKVDIHASMKSSVSIDTQLKILGLLFRILPPKVQTTFFNERSQDFMSIKVSSFNSDAMRFLCKYNVVGSNILGFVLGSMKYKMHMNCSDSYGFVNQNDVKMFCKDGIFVFKYVDVERVDVNEGLFSLGCSDGSEVVFRIMGHPKYVARVGGMLTQRIAEHKVCSGKASLPCSDLRLVPTEESGSCSPPVNKSTGSTVELSKNVTLTIHSNYSGSGIMNLDMDDPLGNVTRSIGKISEVLPRAVENKSGFKNIELESKSGSKNMKMEKKSKPDPVNATRETSKCSNTKRSPNNKTYGAQGSKYLDEIFSISESTHQDLESGIDAPKPGKKETENEMKLPGTPDEKCLYKQIEFDTGLTKLPVSSLATERSKRVKCKTMRKHSPIAKECLKGSISPSGLSRVTKLSAFDTPDDTLKSKIILTEASDQIKPNKLTKTEELSKLKDQTKAEEFSRLEDQTKTEEFSRLEDQKEISGWSILKNQTKLRAEAALTKKPHIATPKYNITSPKCDTLTAPFLRTRDDAQETELYSATSMYEPDTTTPAICKSARMGAQASSNYISQSNCPSQDNSVSKSISSLLLHSSSLEIPHATPSLAQSRIHCSDSQSVLSDAGGDVRHCRLLDSLSSKESETSDTGLLSKHCNASSSKRINSYTRPYSPHTRSKPQFAITRTSLAESMSTLEHDLPASHRLLAPTTKQMNTRSKRMNEGSKRISEGSKRMNKNTKEMGGDSRRILRELIYAREQRIAIQRKYTLEKYKRHYTRILRMINRYEKWRVPDYLRQRFN